MRPLPPGPWHPAAASWRLDLGVWPSKCDPRPGPSRRWALAPSPRRPRHLAHGVQLMAPTLSALSGAPATLLSQFLPSLGSRAVGTGPLASGPWHTTPAPWRLDLRAGRQSATPGQGPQGVGLWHPAHDVRGIWPAVSSAWHQPSVPCLGLPPRTLGVTLGRASWARPRQRLLDSQTLVPRPGDNTEQSVEQVRSGGVKMIPSPNFVGHVHLLVEKAASDIRQAE